MPIINVPGFREAFVNVFVASFRPQGVPAHIIPNAPIHDEIASQVEAAFMEYKHLTENYQWVPAAKQITTYLPDTVGDGTGRKFYACRTLMPEGSIVDVDQKFGLDILRIRYSLVFAILPGSLIADEKTGNAFNRHWQAAFKALLVTGYSFTTPIFIPGDEGERPGEGTQIDIMLEMGGFSGRLPYDKLVP